MTDWSNIEHLSLHAEADLDEPQGIEVAHLAVAAGNLHLHAQVSTQLNIAATNGVDTVLDGIPACLLPAGPHPYPYAYPYRGESRAIHH